MQNGSLGNSTHTQNLNGHFLEEKKNNRRALNNRELLL